MDPRDESTRVDPDREIDTTSAVLRCGSDGIMRIVLKAGVVVTLQDLREHIALGAQLGAVHRGPVLVDSRRIRAVSREAREFFSSPEAAEIIGAQAIVVGSPVSRLIGSFFLGLSKPLFPTKLFTSEAQAIAWLRGFLP